MAYFDVPMCYPAGTPDAADRLADLVIATAPALSAATASVQQGSAA